MATTDCRSFREALLGYLGHELEVNAFENQYVVTLPLKTLDDRFLHVYIEEHPPDYLVVHDGGRTTTELFVQGIHLNNTKEELFKEIARRYGANYGDGSFMVGCKQSEAQDAILAIAQCASLAMHEVLTHKPDFAEERPSLIVKRTLNSWKPDHIELRHRLPVHGHTPGAKHTFDSVAFSKLAEERAVAVQALAFGYGPQVQADRYGFLVLDIRGTVYDEWQRLAVVSKAEQWPPNVLEQVRSLSAKTLEVRSGDDKEIERQLPSYVEELAAA